MQRTLRAAVVLRRHGGVGTGDLGGLLGNNESSAATTTTADVGLPTKTERYATAFVDAWERGTRSGPSSLPGLDGRRVDLRLREWGPGHVGPRAV